MEASLAGLDGLNPGWREILLVLILLIILYMIWLLWNMRRMQRDRRRPASPLEPRVASPLDNLGEARDEDDAAYTYSLSPRPVLTENEPRVEEALSRREPAWTPPDNAAGFAQQAFMDGVERELEQVREEMDALRGGLAALRQEVAGLHETFQQEVLAARAAQNASPLYSDAMQMAILGHDALTISERCGIARAEAELVVALVKNKDVHSP